MSLAELQRALQAAVLHGTNDASAVVAATDSFANDARIEVYRNAFHQRLAAALAVNYPALSAVLGEARFRKLARDFTGRYPPRHFSIRYSGAALPEFIAAHSGIAQRGLSELARWEWSLATAFDAADCKPLAAQALAAIAPEDWQRLTFACAPSLQRIALTTNAVQWWRAVTGETKRPTRWRLATRTEWAIWRKELNPSFRSLDADEAAALDAALQGCTCAQICECLGDHSEEPALRAAVLLQTWFRDGWIVGIALTDGRSP